MTTFEPTPPVPDDERLSRYLDGDLDPAEAAALRRELAADAVLRARLDVLARVVDQVGSLHDDGGAEADRIDFSTLRERALAAWAAEETVSSVGTAVGPAGEHGHLAAVAVTPAGRRWRSRPPLVGLSAAAALALVAGLALLVERGGSDDQAERAASLAAAPTSTYSRQRATAPAAAEAAANAMSSPHAAGGEADRSRAAPAAQGDDATGPWADTTQAATSSPAPQVSSLGEFASYDALLEAVRAQPLVAATTSDGTPATSPPGAPSSSTTTAAAAGSEGATTCSTTHPGSATVDGLPVRWAVQGDGSADTPSVIEVVDAATCAVVARQAR